MKYIEQIIKKLFCLHKWEIWKEVNVTDDSYGEKYKIFHFECKECGRFKRIKSS